MKWFVLAGETAEQSISTETQGVEKVTKWLGNPEGNSGGAGWGEYHKHLQIFTAAAEAVKKHPLWQGELKQEPLVTTFPGLALTVFLFKSEAGNRTFTAFEATGYEGVVVKQKELEGAELPASAENSPVATPVSAPELAEPHSAAETIVSPDGETQPEVEIASASQPEVEMSTPEVEIKAEPEEKKTEASEGEGEKSSTPAEAETTETSQPTPAVIQPEG